MPVKTDNEELMEYARQICENLEDRNVRVELDDRAEKLDIVCARVRFRRYRICL